MIFFSKKGKWKQIRVSVHTPVTVFADRHVLEVKGALPEHLSGQVSEMTVTPVIDDDVVDNLLTVGPELVDDSVLVGGALFGDFVEVHDLLQQEIHPPGVVVLVKLSGAVEGGHSTAPATSSSTCQGKDFIGTRFRTKSAVLHRRIKKSKHCS